MDGPMDELMDVSPDRHDFLLRCVVATKIGAVDADGPQWGTTAKNSDVSTGPLACPFARLLTPLTCSLAPDCSLRSRPGPCALAALTRSLARSLHSLPHSWESELFMSHNDLVLSHSAMDS